MLRRPSGWRALAIGWSALLLALIGFGTFSTERPGAITWGQTSAVWAMAIAISDLEYDLDGGLGYREVEGALASRMTTMSSAVAVHDYGTGNLASMPDVTTAALRYAASLDEDRFIKGGDPEQGSFVSLGGEDIGFANFLVWAYRIYGYDAYSPRDLYLTILFLGFIVFVAVYWRSNAAIALVTLGVAGLFGVTASGVFVDGLPSIAANRFLSTLVIIPILHVICAVLRFARWRLSFFLALALQAWLISFAVSARSSAGWGPLAFLLVALVALMAWLALAWWDSRPDTMARLREWRARMQDGAVRLVSPRGDLRWRPSPAGPEKQARPFHAAHILAVLLTVLAVNGVANNLREMRLDPLYSGEGVLGHHPRWHNAYIALAMHPDWPQTKPYPEQNDGLNDNISWVAFYAVAEERGINPLHPAGLLRVRVLDEIIKEEYLRFIREHPRYVAELFLIYKPIAYWNVSSRLIPTVQPVAWLLMLVSAGIAGLMLTATSAWNRTALWGASVITVGMAQLPAFWAYAADHAFSDQLWSLLFAFLLIVATLVMAGVQYSARLRDGPMPAAAPAE